MSKFDFILLYVFFAQILIKEKKVNLLNLQGEKNSQFEN